MIVDTFPVGPFQCNCTVIGCESTGKAIVVDPGEEASRVMEVLAGRRLAPVAILHTHAHLDHLGGTRALAEAFGCPALLHESDLFLYRNVRMQASLFHLEAPPCPPDVDRFLRDDDGVPCGDVEIRILHTPGHTPGSVTFCVPGDPPILLTGDTLFRDSIGRTDLWGGDLSTILRSIQQRLLPFPEQARVVPGHGKTTTLARERLRNPFLCGLF